MKMDIHSWDLFAIGLNEASILPIFKKIKP